MDGGEGKGGRGLHKTEGRGGVERPGGLAAAGDVAEDEHGEEGEKDPGEYGECWMLSVSWWRLGDAAEIHTPLSIPKINLNTRIRATPDNRRIPHFRQGPALEVGGQGESGVDDGHDGDEAGEEDAPLAGAAEQGHEEEAYRGLAEGGADEVPRLADDVELQGAGLVGLAALEDAEDGAD